jgi:hypothetical protein
MTINYTSLLLPYSTLPTGLGFKATKKAEINMGIEVEDKRGVG